MKQSPPPGSLASQYRTSGVILLVIESKSLVELTEVKSITQVYS